MLGTSVRHKDSCDHFLILLLGMVRSDSLFPCREGMTGCVKCIGSSSILVATSGTLRTHWFSFIHAYCFAGEQLSVSTLLAQQASSCRASLGWPRVQGSVQLSLLPLVLLESLVLRHRMRTPAQVLACCRFACAINVNVNVSQSALQVALLELPAHPCRKRQRQPSCGFNAQQHSQSHGHSSNLQAVLCVHAGY